jgi:hypothetical protein
MLRLELRGLRGDGGQFEEFDQLQGRAEFSTERGVEANELDRAAPEGGEGVVEPDVLESENAAPDFGEAGLCFRARFHEGLGDLGARMFRRGEQGVQRFRIAPFGGDALGEGGVEETHGTAVPPVIDRQDAGPA